MTEELPDGFRIKGLKMKPPHLGAWMLLSMHLSIKDDDMLATQMDASYLERAGIDQSVHLCGKYRREDLENTQSTTCPQWSRDLGKRHVGSRQSRSSSLRGQIDLEIPRLEFPRQLRSAGP